MSEATQISRLDFLIITPLAEERDAVLSYLPQNYKLPPSEKDIRTYYSSSVPVVLPNGAVSAYSLVVMPLTQMGQIDATAATVDAIRRWAPRYVILTGIAGGIARNGVALGDILIADQVIEYERAKQMPDRNEIRWRTHSVDQRLLEAAKNFHSGSWADIEPPRPQQGQPKVHFGPMCTGDKVIADSRALQKQTEVWTKLVGVEMEAGGVVNAVAQAAAAVPGFIMVRGVSDLADSRKNIPTVTTWRQYACAIAGAFVVKFICSVPVPLLGLIERVDNSADNTKAKLTDTLSVHIQDIEKWSSTIDVLGMLTPKAMADVYIALTMTDDQRAHRIGKQSTEISLTVDDALQKSAGRMVILGDPGAGKTTTLKKVASRIIEKRRNGDGVTPIVVRLRDFRKNDSLIEHLADVASFAVYDRERRELPLAWTHDRTHQSTARLIASALSTIGAILLIDGLDELNPTARGTILNEINLLCESSFTGGVVLTCRSADFVRKPDGFLVFEIEPLRPTQQDQLIGNWFATSENRLRTAAEFEAAISSVPYKDLQARPLALTNLCIVFEKYGYLPPSPVTIYRKIVQLLLEEWDSERGVLRYSRYAGFDAARKLDFLAALSYEMDVVRGSGATFSTNNLREAYREICARFHLPVEDAPQVAEEIESHSGLIVRTTMDTFEFSHKSLQEYLTAEYISRLRLLPTLGILLRKYPNELAIAVALASDPAEWFSSLFLVEGSKGRLRKLNVPVEPFLARLTLEQPTFGICPELGFTLLWMLSKWSIGEEIVAFCNLANVGASIKNYLSVYTLGVAKASNGLGSFKNKVIIRPLSKATGKFGAYWEIELDRPAADLVAKTVKNM